MRLNEEERKAIVESFRENFGEGRIYLFGSRVDDTRYGGDIDLYVELGDQPDTARKKIDFLVTLKRKIGERKIDVIIDRRQNRPIDRKAKEEGILLWPKS